jgi:hypothetical protein
MNTHQEESHQIIMEHHVLYKRVKQLETELAWYKRYYANARALYLTMAEATENTLIPAEPEDYQSSIESEFAGMVKTLEEISEITAGYGKRVPF